MARGLARRWIARGAAVSWLALSAGAAFAAEAPASETYRGNLQLGGAERTTMELGLAYRHGVPYSFTHVRVFGFPVECEDGEGRGGLDVRFPPAREIPHPLISADGRFRTLLIDFNGSTANLRGRFAADHARGSLRYRSRDKTLEGFATGKLAWRLLRRGT